MEPEGEIRGQPNGSRGTTKGAGSSQLNEGKKKETKLDNKDDIDESSESGEGSNRSLKKDEDKDEDHRGLLMTLSFPHLMWT